MKCFYHTDMDGHCAGAIVYKYLEEEYPDEVKISEFIPINYNNDFPFCAIYPGEKVFIVDFSLQKTKEFEKLTKITKDIIWIDHHKTAIEQHEYLKLKGLRSVKKSGAELTWKYLYPTRPVPPAVSLVGDYDTWKFEYGENSNRFQMGIRLKDNHPKDEVWKTLLMYPYNTLFLQKILDDGDLVLKYKRNRNKSLAKYISFYTVFEGFRAIACNEAMTSSQLFDSIDKETYDIMLAFSYDGKQWTVSIYSTKEEIDVSKIAKKYGGGGHKGAAGFQCKELPFKKGEQNV